MDLDKIEDTYRKDLEKTEQEFSKEVKNNLDIKQIEENYRKRVELARKKYYASMAGLIGQEKVLASKKKKKKTAEEKLEELNIRPGDYGPTFFEKMKLNWSLRVFKLKFKWRNFHRTHTPLFVSYNFLKIKIMAKKISSLIKEFFSNVYGSVRNSIVLAVSKTKEFFGAVYKKMIELPGKVLSLLKKLKPAKKKKENPAEKKEDSGEKKDGAENKGEESVEPNSDQNK
jgi:hypothetical protein